jgi:glycosyltransferase involved in cell wall biosynthesis
VVVPVRNRRARLRILLDALDRQTLVDHEVIVVDDGSSDGSGDEAAADEQRGRPVTVLRTAGVGAVAARAAGVAVARAPFLAFTDSDCVPDPGWLAAGVAALEAGADVAHGPTVPARQPGPLERSVASGEGDGLYTTSNVFYRRSAFEAVGGFDVAAAQWLGFRWGRRAHGLGFGEDTLLAWNVRRAGRAAYTPDARVVHAVLPADPADAFSRAWMAGAFPGLLRAVPELRPRLLRWGIVLGRPSRLAAGAAVALVLAGRPYLAAGAVALWLADHRPRRTAGSSGPEIVAALTVELALDVVAEAALLAGSLRARSLVV